MVPWTVPIGARARAYGLSVAVAVPLGCGNKSADEPSVGSGATSSPGEKGGASGGTTSTGGPASLPEVWIHNVVDTPAHNQVRDYLAGTAHDLQLPAKKFYEAHGDDYDFLYFLADVASGTGRFVSVRRPAMPSIGLPNASDNGLAHGSAARLKATIGLKLTATGNGPTLHETAHYWGAFLDSSFGFGEESTDDQYGPHWGRASIDGSLGGYDHSSLTCDATGAPPTGSPPSCPTSAVTLDAFAPGAGTDAKPYAPMELYLMGLVNKSQVPSPIYVMEGSSFVSWDQAADTFAFTVGSFKAVSMSDIVSVHGERPAATQTSFRAAFVLVSTSPASQADLDRAEAWAKIFGDEPGVSNPIGLLSFNEATGDRAELTTRLGP